MYHVIKRNVLPIKDTEKEVHSQNSFQFEISKGKAKLCPYFKFIVLINFFECQLKYLL